MEGTSDFNLAMEWYLKYGEREITPKALKLIRNSQEEADRRDAYFFKLESETTDPN